MSKTQIVPPKGRTRAAKRRPRTAVVLGRFQIVTNAHLDLLEQAAQLEPDQIVIGVGSAGSPRRVRNPLMYAERVQMLKEGMRWGKSDLVNDYLRQGLIKIDPIYDMTYRDQEWVAQVQQVVAKHDPDQTEQRPVLVGYAKDPTTDFYLNMFGPVYDTHSAREFQINGKRVDATTIRNRWLATGSCWGDADVLPVETVELLDKFAKDETPYLNGMSSMAYLRREYEAIRNYRSGWEKALAEGHLRYEPTFHTVDAMVVCAGHVLMVKRGKWPGKGLWALPGGYLKPNEYTVQGALRELREETQIDVPDKVLLGSIQHCQQFDDPYRSERGRVLTTTQLFHLPATGVLPTVIGSDDAEEADWILIDRIKESMCFEDHFAQIGILKGHLKDHPR
jgi:bifunctional NMN adenylyltransferase/nudix hydrolase